jgi:hypothetical protein
VYNSQYIPAHTGIKRIFFQGEDLPYRGLAMSIWKVFFRKIDGVKSAVCEIKLWNMPRLLGFSNAGISLDSALESLYIHPHGSQ